MKDSDIIIVEIIISDIAVFKTNQPVAFNDLLIKVNLNFGVFSNDL